MELAEVRFRWRALVLAVLSRQNVLPQTMSIFVDFHKMCLFVVSYTLSGLLIHILE
jgi:hypothetical protein